MLDRARVYDVVLVPGERRIECMLAAALGQILISTRRFGSSDCRCPAHLFFAAARSDLETAVTQALAGLTSHWRRLATSKEHCSDWPDIDRGIGSAT